MVKLQGPSLFVFNNALFTDEDFENLSKLGGATKQNKVEKIGKFGLGFCSLYNMTGNHLEDFKLQSTLFI